MAEEEQMHDSDLAVAIGYDAFCAGYMSRHREGQQIKARQNTLAGRMEDAWSEYTPPEELCGREFKKPYTKE